MNKKYLVDVTDLSPNSPNSFDPKSLFTGDINNPPFTHGFPPPPQRESFSLGLLLLACLIAPLISPDLRNSINFDYSPSSHSEKLLPGTKK